MTLTRFTTRPLVLAAVLLALSLNALAQQPAPAPTATDEARVGRLIGLAKVWSAVKYFHPSLAYQTNAPAVVPRSFGNADRAKLFAVMQRTTPVVQVLPSGYGYVDLARLQTGEVDQMFETIKSAPAVIFDMHGYPNGTGWAISPRLTEKRQPVAALFSRPLLEATSLSNSELAETPSYTFAQRIPERKGDVYRGKVVMLINEDAISQAEHTCMFFEAATDVTFVGTPTTGANGDVTYMVLPGNLAVSFTGHNVRHADGRQLQRVGIQPTVKVAPTVSGVVAGRDEILEAAVKYLQENVKK